MAVLQTAVLLTLYFPYIIFEMCFGNNISAILNLLRSVTIWAFFMLGVFFLTANSPKVK